MGFSSSSSDGGPRHTTAFGARVIVRPIQPGDAPALHAAFHALSEESRYRRFMGHVTDLSPDMLRYLCDVDDHDHVAYVAFSEEENLEPGKLVGVARFIRARDEIDTAEFAITVADELHGLGLGSLLLDILSQAALARGVRRFTAHALRDNDAIRRVLLHHGPTTLRDADTLELRLRRLA